MLKYVLRDFVKNIELGSLWMKNAHISSNVAPIIHTYYDYSTFAEFVLMMYQNCFKIN